MGRCAWASALVEAQPWGPGLRAAAETDRRALISKSVRSPGSSRPGAGFRLEGERLPPGPQSVVTFRHCPVSRAKELGQKESPSKGMGCPGF